MFRKAFQRIVLYIVNKIIDGLEAKICTGNIHAFISEDEKKTVILACHNGVKREHVTGIPERILGYHIKIRWID